MLWLTVFSAFLILGTSAVYAEGNYAEELAKMYGGDLINTFIEDFALEFSAAANVEVTPEVFARLRSFKIAAFYEAATELDRRITEMIRTDVSEEYAEAWSKEKAGFILGSLPKILALQNVADDKHIETVCETGFNVGYGVLNVLIANPSASVVSFDIFLNKYSPYAVRALHDMFPHRDITVVAGDASVSVPHFFKKVGANTVCDMAFVDSGEPIVRGRDIVNLAPHMNYNVRRRNPQVNPIPNLVLKNGRIVPAAAKVPNQSTMTTGTHFETTLLNEEFSHVLIVDDLHGKELRAIYDNYVDQGFVTTLDLFEVSNTPCVARVYVREPTTDFYSFDTEFCYQFPDYVEPKFVDSIFMKSKYLKASIA